MPDVVEPVNDGKFMQLYQGFLAGVMRWEALEQLWQTIVTQNGDWYIYAVGEEVPRQPVTAEQLLMFTRKIHDLLQQEHDEDYCGIVYANNLKQPDLVKIYDPNNLGMVCGSSENPPLPGWIMSKTPPIDLLQAFPPPQGRRRWWQKIFS